MGKVDEGLKRQRLVFYQEDVEKIDKTLKDFLEASGARCSLLIDKDGHLVTRVGDSGTFDLDTISALVAGSFAATKEMARLLGESEFSVMFHQGRKDSIQLSLIGERTILAVIFNDSTTLGMVRHYANQVGSKLAELFTSMEARPARKPDIEQGFTEAAKGKLDDLFGS